jgi:hypothetical protein
VSQVTELVSGQVTAAGLLTIELAEADTTRTKVIGHWPSKPTVLHQHRFPYPLTVRHARLLLRYGWQQSAGAPAVTPVLSIGCD